MPPDAQPTMSSHAVVCPHCGYEHGDPHEYCSDEESGITCDECGEEFTAWAYYEVTYHAEVKR